MKAPETQVLKACLDYLRIKGHLAYRINNGAFQTKNGGYVRCTDTPGVPDILGFTIDGRGLAVEVKSDKGKLSKAQETQKAAIIERGGLYVLARRIEDLISAGL
jgi:hypothetical protein